VPGKPKRLDGGRLWDHIWGKKRKRGGDLTMYTSETNGIRVSVEPTFLDDQSTPDESHYVWAYRVHIENNSARTVQLRNRYWRITDAAGLVHEVRGPGVVGKEPVLEPGETYDYTSGAPLKTPSGIMVGSYEMESPNGDRFDVAIPAFSLDSPYQAVRLN